MKIQQAIFTSSDRSQIKGYQLVAKSADIDRNIEKELYRWSPSHMGSDNAAMWTINYFPVSEDCVAVARTVSGGPEYSGRGGSQIVTIIVLLNNGQFAAYHNNPMLIAQTVMALGGLRLPPDMPGRNLGTFELPDHPFVGTADIQKSLQPQSASNNSAWHSGPLNDGGEASLLADIADLLDQKRRLAIIGASSPTEMVGNLILHLSIPDRRDFSFTTGLPPALHRPFQAHFLPDSNTILNQMLKSEGITIVQVPSTGLTQPQSSEPPTYSTVGAKLASSFSAIPRSHANAR